MSIKFTQYLMPDGLEQQIKITRPPEIQAMADELAAKGYRFEIEMLTTGEVSMEVVMRPEDPDADVDSLAAEICVNGPTEDGRIGVPEGVDRLLKAALRLKSTA